MRIKKWFNFVKEVEGLHGLATWDPLKTYIYPILAPGLTAVLGLIGNIPLMWIFVAAMASFAFVATGLLRLDEWQNRVDPLGKLFFSHPSLEMIATYIIKDDGNGNKTQIPFIFGGSPVIHLINKSTYQIDFYIVRIYSSLRGRTYINPVYNSKGFTVDPGASAFYRDSFIKVDMEINEEPIIAITEIEIDYWRKPTDKRKLNLKVRQTFGIDSNTGNVVASGWEFDSESQNLVRIDANDARVR